MSGAALPHFGRAETFRVMAPGGCLMTWTIVSGFVTSMVLFLCLWMFVRDAEEVREVRGALCLATMTGFWCAVPWIARRLVCPIRWVRVSPEMGITLSDGRTVPWTDVRGVEQTKRVVVLHALQAKAVESVELYGVRGPYRLAALVRRYAGLDRPEAA